MSLFQLVYGIDIVFPTFLDVPVMKIFQEVESEPNEIQRRIIPMINLQQSRDEVFNNISKLHDIVKKIFDKKTKADDFKIGNIVLRWDDRNEEKGKHGKFDTLWKGPYNIVAFRGKTTFFLEDLKGQEVLGGPINGRFLKHYVS